MCCSGHGLCGIGPDTVVSVVRPWMESALIGGLVVVSRAMVKGGKGGEGGRRDGGMPRVLYVGVLVWGGEMEGEVGVL